MPTNWATGTQEVALATTSPIVQRWELSAWLRALRHEAGLTIEQVAEALACSPAKVSRMETGLRGVQPRDVRDLADLYALSDQERRHLAGLAQGARQKAWYDKYKLPSDALEFYGVEASARHVRWMETAVVPGVFQTPRYTKEVLSMLGGLPEQSLLNLDDQVEIRRRRQEHLLGGQVQLDILITEETLGHRAGTAEIMSEQLERLVDVAQMETVDLRVLPLSESLAPAAAGPFIVLSLHSPKVGDRVFRERGLDLSEKQDEIERYTSFFDELKEIALSRSKSLESLQRARAAWGSPL